MKELLNRLSAKGVGTGLGDQEGPSLARGKWGKKLGRTWTGADFGGQKTK